MSPTSSRVKLGELSEERAFAEEMKINFKVNVVKKTQEIKGSPPQRVWGFSNRDGHDQSQASSLAGVGSFDSYQSLSLHDRSQSQSFAVGCYFGASLRANFLVLAVGEPRAAVTPRLLRGKLEVEAVWKLQKL